MIYKCRNCGANAVYSPEKGTMYCPYCDSQDSEELGTGRWNGCLHELRR